MSTLSSIRAFRREVLPTLAFLGLACAALQAQTPPEVSSLSAAQWKAIGAAWSAAASQERDQQDIPSIALGIVDARGEGWQGAVGFADAAKTRVADPQGLYRIGSMTELLTDILVLQVSERGMLDLDAPVQQYLKDFRPHPPSGRPITLRMLLTHHSGLAEGPRGHPADAHPPGLAEVVRGLNPTTLLFEPGTSYHYSSAELAVAARVLEVVTGKSYEVLLQQALLQPLGMTSTSVRLTPPVRAGLVYAQRAPFDDVRSAAPLFDTGAAPANNANSNIGDLTRLAVPLLNGGKAADSRILERVTLDTLLSLQSPNGPGAPSGIGFSVSSLDGHRTARKAGGIYGFTSDLSIYPDDGVAVFVMIALDEAGPARERLRDYAARLIFAARAGDAEPHYPNASDPIPEPLSNQIAGHYAHGTDTLDIRVVEAHSYLEAPRVAAELRRDGARWVLDDVLTFREDVSVNAAAGVVTLGGIAYQRAPNPKPAPADAEIARLMGSYGWEYSYLRIYERDGHPYARLGNSDYAPLVRVRENVYRPADDDAPTFEFLTARDGKVNAIRFDGIVWPRRDFGAEAEARVHAAVKDVPGLRDTAWKATPPVVPRGLRAPELVEVARVEPTIKLDIGYATRQNFMGIAVYDEPRAFLQRPAAAALIRAHEKLGKDYDYGILIHDTYRPWAVTKMFWDATPPAMHDFVADPAEGSRHNRGCAADITLYDRTTGEMLEMAGRYDETSARSMPIYVGGSSLQRWRRDVLKQAVEAEGFKVYRFEWWHFDHALWRQYPVMNLNFRDIAAPAAAQ